LRKELSFSSGSSGISDAIRSRFEGTDTDILVIKPNTSPLFEFKGQKFLIENCTIEISIPYSSSSDLNLNEFVQSMIHIFKINLSGASTSYSVTFRDNYFRFPIVDREFPCSGTNCDKYYWKSSNKYYSVLTFTLFNADEANTEMDETNAKMIVFFFSGNSIETYVVRKLIPSSTDYTSALNYHLSQIIGRYLLKTLVPERSATASSSNYSSAINYYQCWWTTITTDSLCYRDQNNNCNTVFGNFAFRPYCGSSASFITNFLNWNSLFLSSQ
jgi:hypothetical protein